MLKTITFESHKQWKVLNENEFYYSVLKSSCYQPLDSRIKNMMVYLKKLK